MHVPCCYIMYHCNWPNSQIPQCTCSISHNAPFRTKMCTFLFWMVHCGIRNWCTVGFVWLVYCMHLSKSRTVKIMKKSFHWTVAMQRSWWTQHYQTKSHITEILSTLQCWSWWKWKKKANELLGTTKLKLVSWCSVILGQLIPNISWRIALTLMTLLSSLLFVWFFYCCQCGKVTLAHSPM